MSTIELTIPPSRIANAVNGVVDLAEKLTRPLFVDVENVPSRGPFVLVGNHQLFAMLDVPYLVHGLQVLRGVRVRGMTDHFQFAVPLWRSWLASSGAVPGTRENCAAFLAAGEPVLVFPEAHERSTSAATSATSCCGANGPGSRGWRSPPAARSSRSLPSAPRTAARCSWTPVSESPLPSAPSSAASPVATMSEPS